MNWMQLFLATASLALTTVGSFAGYLGWRNRQLRRDEVLKWADECITCLQTLFIISEIKDAALTEADRNQARLRIIFDTSILIERGRIFFKNEKVSDYGVGKFPAYRGYRPRILDHLVIAHKVARYWPEANIEEQARLSIIVKDCLQQFVSLAQQEVGRSRAASVEALKGGSDSDLKKMISCVDPKRLG
ncbi:MAG: hypothetical protein Q8K28_16575 [Hoeflea sp.]|uniref:hypothetical protein n=1 Tax=Hoeflea sp. TaxID=1940281 RepID=UPI002730E916|nr:hypothetical protein [Hoeflea sp.]MDP2121514.1 hypothetical protein [Hoeflea sp.]